MTTLGPSLTITGEVTCQEDMTVHGRVNGQITMEQGSLVVAPTGSADANLQGLRITIHGKAAGELVASERVELTDTAVVTGTITTPSLVLRDGAVFNGLIETTAKKGNKTAAPKPTVAENVAQAS